MDEHVYKKMEITGSSRSSIEDGVQLKQFRICDGLKSLKLAATLKTTKSLTGR